jgi:ABC-type antimicrobial peptide transport system permease subunit
VAGVLRSASVTVGAGLVLGGAAATAAGRAVSFWLFGVGPFDPVTLATVVLVPLAAGLAAAWLPARRAARIDPLAAIRSE